VSISCLMAYRDRRRPWSSDRRRRKGVRSAADRPAPSRRPRGSYPDTPRFPCNPCIVYPRKRKPLSTSCASWGSCARGNWRPATSLPDYLDRFYRRGLIDRVARGLYAWPDADLGENQTLAEAARGVPRGVVCLLSALRFHGVTTHTPAEVGLALPPKAWLPRVKHPKLRVFRFSDRALTDGVEDHAVHGTVVRVYGPAKTVADCFKYRNKVGSTWPWRRCATAGGNAGVPWTHSGKPHAFAA
jgi:hypothetical protein